MDPITLGIIASVAGAGLNAYAGSQAAKRQQQQAMEMQARQLQMRNQATEVAAQRARDFDPTARDRRQQDIQRELTSQFENTVSQPQISAQGVSIGATLPSGEGGTDYLKAQAREATKSTASLRALAALMGRTGGATELRRQEAIDFGDAEGAIGRIRSGAGQMAQIDNMGVQAAGVPNLFTQLTAAGLQAYGGSQLNKAAIAGPAPRTNDMGLWAKATNQDPMGWWLRNGVGAD